MYCASTAVKPLNDEVTPVHVLAAGLVVNLLLVLPAWWRDGAVGSVWIAPEAWLLPALVALLPISRVGRAVRIVLGGLLGFLIVAGFFDALVQSVLGRALNVFIDPLMLRAGFHLVEGSLGRWAAILASCLLALAVLAVFRGVFLLLARVTGPAARSVPAIVLASAIVGLPGVVKYLPGVQSQLQGQAAQQLESFGQTRRARAELLAAATGDAFGARALPGLAGRDVYIVFVESYGASALDQKRHAGRIVPLLERWGERLASAGLSVVSGRLEAPIRGGQSWLSHATLLAGLSIDSQIWYDLLLDQEIDLLSHDLRATGHTAVNIAPGIVREWPEGDHLGFDRVFAAADLGYEGPRLGWATMPDEYTLHAFSEHVRPRFDGPVFAQIALISSHWPWQPVIEPVSDPAAILWGRVYDQWQGRVDHPVSLWFDPGRMREAYVRSIEYSLEVTLAWAQRSLPEDALLIVLGDHQPVSLITGRNAGASVPVHVISGEKALLEGFTGRGFDSGLVPSPAAEAPAMSRLRHWLRCDFESPVAVCQDGAP